MSKTSLLTTLVATFSAKKRVFHVDVATLGACGLQGRFRTIIFPAQHLAEACASMEGSADMFTFQVLRAAKFHNTSLVQRSGKQKAVSSAPPRLAIARRMHTYLQSQGNYQAATPCQTALQQTCLSTVKASRYQVTLSWEDGSRTKRCGQTRSP